MRLLKKIDRARIFLNRYQKIFHCPYCHSRINQIDGYSLVCDEGHRFDLSKKGTLFLIKHGVKSDYDQKGLWNARRHVLQSGFFDEIIKQIVAKMPQRPLAYIDVGCGEGTVLSKIREARTNFDDCAVGIDISKDAINLATQQSYDSFFCVADLAALPFQNNKIDVLIDILSPSSYQEFERVLSSGGILFKVIPNANYLIELRHRLYQPDDPRYSYQNDDVLRRIKTRYPQTNVIPIKYEFILTDNLAHDLLKMTPLQWGNQAHLNNAFLAPLRKVTVDMSLLVTQMS